VGDDVRAERWLDLRYRGTDHALTVREPDAGPAGFAAAFEQEHRTRFGYDRPERAIEIVTARVRVVGEDGAAIALGARRPDDAAPIALRARNPDQVAPAPSAAPEPLRRDAIWFPGLGRAEAPIFLRESLRPGCMLEGPAVLLEATGTVVVDPGFSLEVEADGLLVLRDRGDATREAGGGADAAAGPSSARPYFEAPAATSAAHSATHDEEADPVRLEVFGARFKSMAEQMGAVLRNTSVSTNIKDRLDYSCAVFDEVGGLVANAPHIPVHLGAMAETVRVVRERFAANGEPLVDGDVVVTNDPACGGSHLPDVTVVTPVFLAPGDAEPGFFVASRGHHAEIGGRTPGSMPPDSTRLDEEGVVLAPFKAVSAGRFDEVGVRTRLTSGPWPSRRPDDNVADLAAMIAANRQGEQLLQAFAAQEGVGRVRTTMHQLQRTAAAKVSAEIARFEDGEHRFEDRLDDGTPVCVTLRIDGGRMQVDFSGTGAPHAGNLNAPSAVVKAALIYVLRSLVDARMPLNGGCLDPVELVIPHPSLLDPPEGAAVVGGNVETSQRVVDVLLGALGVAAASQGTMNNVTFGDASFGYYETIGGGAGAGPGRAGASGVHTHMTNTRITDPELLETRYPVLLERFSLRRGSGGAGRWTGGDGLVREYRFLAPVTATLLTERRTVAPWGAAGGGPGAMGENRVIRNSGEETVLAARCSVALSAGDRLRVSTPGGGGWGRAGD
jgi:5-oxoprolinase (ATP-hydrolysing)